MPRLGMGTWYLGNDRKKRAEEIAALQAGINAGVKLIDTAEMYGDGRAEELIGEAIGNCDRKSLFLVSKVYPHNAGRANMAASLDRTLENLGTDYLDLYLLHWRGSIPLTETVECLEQLVEKGKIKCWGVSNFDTDDMAELFDIPKGGNCVVNQVLYHLGSRGIEYDLLPWLEDHRVAVMAYCPLAQAGALKRNLPGNQVLHSMAEHNGLTVIQLMLAFVLKRQSVIAIPRSGKSEHVLANQAAADFILSDEDYEILNREFPAPPHKTYLDIV